MRPGQQDASGGALLAPTMTTTHSTRYDYAHYHNRNTRFQESRISCVAKHIWYPVHAVLYQNAKAHHLAATPGRGFKGSSEVNGLITLSANMIIKICSRGERSRVLFPRSLMNQPCGKIGVKVAISSLTTGAENQMSRSRIPVVWTCCSLLRGFGHIRPLFPQQL